MDITAELLHGASVSRDRLAEWHHKFRGKLFNLVPGFYVRCRQEDSTEGQSVYKVARIKSIRSDWSMELDPLTEEDKRHFSKTQSYTTNYDCVSNSKITEGEYEAFLSQLSVPRTDILTSCLRMAEKMSLIQNILLKDADFVAKRKDKDATQAKVSDSSIRNGSKQEEKLIFSTNVLLLNEEGQYGTTVSLSTLLRHSATNRNTYFEPDTPRINALPVLSPYIPTGAEDRMASHTTGVLLSELESIVGSPTIPMPDPFKLTQTIMHAGRSSAYTSFDYGTERSSIAQTMKTVMGLSKDLLSKEPLFCNITSPVYVFGDIHGNFADLRSFLGGLLTFNDLMMRYSEHSFLFLGDYVDRGSCSLECILYLLCLKLLNPKKVFLLRGNHESPEVNGDTDCYGCTSFKFQCQEHFGQEVGFELWALCNEVFTHLPLCATIDQKIFCVHGGIPQYSGGKDDRMEILRDSNFPRFPLVQCDSADNRKLRALVNDLLWSDPATSHIALDEHGFGPNPRGADIHSFGPQAVDEFCTRFGFQYIFRAHQEKADGLRLSDSARVITIFSTSDYAGHRNGAGCIYVSQKKIRLVIKKPRPARAYYANARSDPSSDSYEDESAPNGYSVPGSPSVGSF